MHREIKRKEARSFQPKNKQESVSVKRLGCDFLQTKLESEAHLVTKLITILAASIFTNLNYIQMYM